MTEPIIVAETKLKDLRRVAAGKRLGAISKQRKEERRLERETQAQAQAQQVTNNEYTLYLVGRLVVVGAVSCLYLNKEKVTEMLTSDKRELSTIPEEPASPPKRKSKRVFGN